MDCDGALGRFAYVQETSDDDVARRAAVHEEQVVMRKAGVCKATSLVHLPVEPDHVADVVLAKVREVRFWGVERESWELGSWRSFLGYHWGIQPEDTKIFYYFIHQSEYINML